MKVKIYSLQ